MQLILVITYILFVLLLLLEFIMERRIFEIARDIQKEWGDKVYFGAKPYLEAMLFLSTPKDKYGFDSASEIVNYFLANASTFRGDNAKKLKSELKEILKG